MSPDLLLAAPFLMALSSAALSFILTRYRFTIQKIALTLHLAASLALAIHVFTEGSIAITAGSWAAPYGIVLIADPFAALMLTLASLIFFSCLLIPTTDKDHIARIPLFFVLQAGVSLSFISGDFFNLFVAFEMMLISSYAFVVNEIKPSMLGNAYSYLSMNILASFLYLISVAALYGYTGSLNLAVLSKLFNTADTTLMMVPLLIIMIALFIKSGLFPLYFWLPDTYPFLPGSTAALFAGVLTKVGIYALYRLFITIFPPIDSTLALIIILAACLTMFLGVMGAVSRSTIKGILSYHILSQIGYMVFALALATPMALTAGIYFTAHNMIVKSSLFLIGDIARTKCRAENLSSMGGLWLSAPFLGVLFLLQALSLAGIPPFSGFWGKYLIFFEALSLKHYGAFFIALITSFFTLFSMIKIWNTAFFGAIESPNNTAKRTAYIGPIILTATAIAMGLFAGSAYDIAAHAAERLTDREHYIAISLNSGVKR